MNPEKSVLRARMTALRSSWSPETRAKRSARIVRRILALDVTRHARTVFAYMPMPGRPEVDVAGMLDVLIARGAIVALPVVLKGRVMVFRTYDGAGGLEEGPFGTRHPRSGPPVEPAPTDIIVVPALAADRSGVRLGWGAGYYDRFLAGTSCPTVCPVFEDCLVDSLPRETHDRTVALIVTEKRVLPVALPS